jgi:hypothetical protein
MEELERSVKSLNSPPSGRLAVLVRASFISPNGVEDDIFIALREFQWKVSRDEVVE